MEVRRKRNRRDSGVAQRMTDGLGRELRTLRVDDSAFAKRDDDENVGAGGPISSIVDNDTNEPDETEPISFTGHAAVFNQRTWIGSKSWGFWEVIAPGAFAKTIQEADVRFLVNHNADLVLARTKSGTLRLSEDSVGLLCDADIAPTTWGDDIATLIQRGDVDQMSFAFECVKETWEELEDGSELRTIQEVRLYDVSVVTYPAYEGTDAGLRAALIESIARADNLDASKRQRLVDAVNQVVASEEPASTTPSDERTQPEDTTGTTEARRLRLQALSKLHGLPLTTTD